MQPLAPQEIDWLGRVFVALARVRAPLDDEAFRTLSECVGERLPHDALALLLREPRAEVARLAAASAHAPLVGGERGERLFARLREEVLPPAGGVEPLLCDDTARGDRAADAELRAAGIGSYAVVPVPLDPAVLGAWMVYAWRTPGEASRFDLGLAARLGRMFAAMLPIAQHDGRARRLAQMLDRLPYGVVSLDGDGRIVDANQAAHRLLAGDGESLLGRPLERFLTAATRPQLQAALVSPSPSERQLLEAERPDGMRTPLDAIVTAVSEGAVRYQVHLENAWARLASEAELGHRAEALAFLRDLAETVAGELSAERALDRATTLITTRLPVLGAAIARVRAGDGGLALLASRGLEPALLARFLSLRVPAAPVGEGAAIVETLEPTAELRGVLGRGRVALVIPLHHAEHAVGVALFAMPHEPDAQTQELLLASARTVGVALHASVEYAEAVRLAFEHRQLLDSIPSIVFRLDPETGATLYASAAVERVLGTPVPQALGLPGLEGLLCDAAEREAIGASRIQVAAGGESGWTDRRFRHRDGRTLILRTRMYLVVEPREGAAGRVVIEGIAQDVTDEFEARKQLVQADRLASLGMLAAGVAHEINNPTAFISLGVQQLARMVAQMPEGQGAGSLRRRMSEVLAELSDGVQRIVQIVGELKLFTRIPEAAFSTPVDVNRLIVSAVTLARAELRHRARVEVELGELPPLPGDHARLGQVFVNLLINAAQAIPPGDDEHNVVRVKTQASSEAIVVEVTDSGVGIAPENLPRIFDPFFTTKAPGEGTGLGLAISYDLVRRAGGNIEVQSEVGKGTRFRVWLPVREFRSPRGSQPRIAPAPLGGRVLIVEDEHHLAAAIARALASTYMVDLAPDAETALARIERGDGSGYDAVLCDLRMPGMDGRAFYQSVCARWPAQAARFVFLTGAGLGGEFESFVRGTDRPVLEKPFEMSELEEVVAHVVSAGGRG